METYNENNNILISSNLCAEWALKIVSNKKIFNRIRSGGRGSLGIPFSLFAITLKTFELTL